MNTRAKLLVLAWFVSTTLIAIFGLAPDDYPYGNITSDLPPQVYAWEYVAIFGVVGAIAITLLSPWSSQPSFWGAAISALLMFSLWASALMSLLHAPRVHGWLMLISFLWSQFLLVYTGYAFAIWRRARSEPGLNVSGAPTTYDR